MPAKIVQYFFLFGALSFLTACSETSYDAAKLPDDAPQPVTSLYLENVVPLSEEFGDSSPKSAPSASIDDDFIAKLVKSDIASDLVHKGYAVAADSSEKHDIDMTVFLFYQPDDWPFTNRYVHLRAELSKPDKPELFHVDASQENWFGSIGDFIGFSAEEMLADTAHQIVDLSSDQMSVIKDHFQTK